MTTDLVPRTDVETVALAEQQEAGIAALLHVLGTGDLSKLTDRERAGHYARLCRSLGLNELSRPFDWIWFKDRETDAEKLVLYANQSCTAQLRRQHHMRVQITRRDVVGELFVCEAKAFTPDGREDVASKYVPLTGFRRGGGAYRLQGQMLANAMMKAETGAKRRVTLSMIGLSSPPDADEVVSWRTATIDGTGRIIENPTAEQKALAADPKMARAIGEPVFEDADAGDEVTSQAARPGELERQPRPSGPPSFRCDKARWSRVWATLPHNDLVDDEPSRRRYIAAYTSGWPEGARTDSLSRLLDVITDVQAQRFMDDTREWLAERAAANAADPTGELDGIDGLTAEQADDEAASQRGYDARPAGMTPEGHAAAVLTGAPSVPTREEDVGPERLDPDREYTRAELRDLYDQWATRMRALDRLWKPDDVKRLPDKALRTAVENLSAQVVDLEDHLSRFDDGDQPDDESSETQAAF